MKRLHAVMVFTLIFTLVLTACAPDGSTTAQTSAAPGTSAAPSDAQPASSPASSAASDAQKPTQMTKVLIGNTGGPRPYAFLDANDELVGYDIELIAAVDRLLPDYEFELEKTEFASIFGGIDSGRYGMGVNNITKKPEREEKYLFGSEWYSYNTHNLLVKKGRTDIQGLADLGGKKVYTSGDGVLFSEVFYRTYNEQHPDNPIDTILSGADTLKVYQDIIDGAVDFALISPVSAAIYKEEYPDLFEQLDVIPLSDQETATIEDPKAWYIYPKTPEGEALREAVDDALRQLAESGEMQTLSKKYFGFNMTGRPDVG